MYPWLPITFPLALSFMLHARLQNSLLLGTVREFVLSYEWPSSYDSKNCRRIILDLGTCWRKVVSVTPRPPSTVEEAPDGRCIGGWVGPIGGLDDTDRRQVLPLPGLELVPLGRRTCSQPLYRLHSPGSRSGKGTFRGKPSLRNKARCTEVFVYFLLERHISGS
jgi:hypothetical protein